MACACSKGKDGKTYQYIVTDKYGQQVAYATEMEARARAARTGGAVRAVELQNA